MKELLSLIRRHPRLSGGIGAMLLAALVVFTVHAPEPAHAAAGTAHAAAQAPAVPTAQGSTAVRGPAPASHSAFTALTRRERHQLRRVTATATRGSNQHGVPTPAPTTAALARSLLQATGLSPAQVESRSVCPAAHAGQATCAADALVLRANGALVRPRVRAQATLGRVHARSSSAKPSTATPASAAEPAPGTPAYLEQAYDLSYLSQTNGANDTVALVDAYDDSTAQADLDSYRSTYGLPACDTGCFTKVNEMGKASPLPSSTSALALDWDVEISLDLDTVSAICPKCHILLVEARSSDTSDLEQAMQTAASMGATQISDSWTMTSSSSPGSGLVPSGVPIVAATGDEGYVGPGQDNYPAALAGVTAAGGTSLASASAASARGFGESAWSGGGSGCDLNVTKPSYQTDTGCTGRSYADLSADADPNTGLDIDDDGNWEVVGGTSLATPMIAAYYAITGVNDATAQWAYTDSGLLNDITSGSNDGTYSCAQNILYICNAGPGYDGPTGVGSISGDVTSGAPGVGGPSIPTGSANSYTEATRSDGATIAGGIYPNGLDTTWWIQYWPASGGTTQETPAADIGAATTPVMVTGYPTHLAANTTYDYELVAENSDGTTDGYTYSFKTASASATTPVASFTSSLALSTPDSVGFNAGGSTDAGATITDYKWDFGDGSTIDDAGATSTVTHQYAAPGAYNVTLTVTNGDGQTETTTQTVVVFSVSPTPLTPGQATFTASNSTTSSDTYSWSFVGPAGQNTTTTTATGANPTESLQRGSYQVTLTVTNVAGQTASTTQTLVVDGPPTFTATSPSSPTVITPGQSVSFSVAATSSDGSTPSYSWNFGDGATGTGADPTHTYTTAGVYTATVTATDDLGASASESIQINVDAPPTASFTTSPTQPAPGTSVSFNASGSSDSVGTINQSLDSWNFGDPSSGSNNTASGPTASHAYANPGTYTVTLTVTNDAGQTATSQRQVIVDDPPTATVTPSATLTTPGSAVSFSSTAAASPSTGGTITTYSWNFGDGSTLNGTDADPSHAYASPGVYNVTLTVTDNFGGSYTASTQVTVDAAPTAAFTASSNPATVGSTVGFNAGGSSDAVGTITGYSWSFGDGATAAGPAPSHAYSSPGTYTVSLTVTNNAGQTATQTGSLTVNSVASTTPPTTNPSKPAPVPTPKPLTASLTGAKKQKLAPALAHGVHVSLAVSQATKASFQITLPVLESRLAGPKHKTGSLVLLRSAQTLGAGTHAITLKLSRSAAGELAGSGPLVLTVKVTLTEPSGGTVSRTLKITLAR